MRGVCVWGLCVRVWRGLALGGVPLWVVVFAFSLVWASFSSAWGVVGLVGPPSKIPKVPHSRGADQGDLLMSVSVSV